MISYIRAFVMMFLAHLGQTDKGNAPYFLHPLRVSRSIHEWQAKIVALLHDVLEDSNRYTINDFYFLNKEQREALLLLNRDRNRNYFEYIQALKMNRLAKIVKLADLQDNLNIKRIKKPTEKDIIRMAKYIRAQCILRVI